MKSVLNIAEYILHLDKYIGVLADSLGPLVYILLFLIIFAETGIVLMPFLPGDSLLFILGALSANNVLSIWILLGLLTLAAILGDSVNYMIGGAIGNKIIGKGLIKKENIIKTEKFYEKYGSKAIVIARFVPIVRTVAPFLAGIGKMNYSKFLTYNIVGATIWNGLFIGGGYFFGNIPIIRENFGKTILIIIIISLLPLLAEYLKAKRGDKEKKAPDPFFDSGMKR